MQEHTRAAPRRWTWWAVLAGAALLAVSQWLHAPSVEYLVPVLVATAAALAASAFVAGVQRWWAWGCSLGLLAAAALSIGAQKQLWRVQHDWESWRRSAVVGGLDALRNRLDLATASATRLGTEALRTGRDRPHAFDRLDELTGQRADQGVVVYVGDSAFAWAGALHAPVDPIRAGTSVTATAFYLALQVAARRADTGSVAVTLIDAAPPGDRLAGTLAMPIATAANLARFAFAPPADSGTSPDVLRYTIAGRRVFDVRAVPLLQGEVVQHITETVRGRAGLAFVLALACFIIGVWRGTRTMSQRAAALAVGLACTALVPLSQYSNLTRLFDPAVYFTAEGGPLTGNAGALAATSALVLLGVLAVYRRHVNRISPWTAALVIVLVAGLGPFLLRDLARGIQPPVHGVDAGLWLIWEIPLFLAAAAVLLAGSAAGVAVLGPRRGAGPWMAPAVAAAASVLAPAVWEAPGRWPWWYTILWIVAIALLALSRRTRFVILSAAAVAALGATTLVWGRTARGRVEAAERDLASLSQPDSVAVTLLQRFGLALANDEAPTTRQSLLQHYVASDVAAAGNPIALSAWPSDSGPAAEFRTADIPRPRGDIARIVAHARQTGMAIIEPVPTDTCVELVMAAPGADGGVTAVVLAPKSRLFQTDPFARLLGLETDPDVEPPYTVRLRGGILPASDTSAIKWRREGTELHGDWIVPTGRAAASAHVEVELRSLDALIQRGALIVLLDLAIVGLLWLASVVADGGAGRWFRVRGRTWRRSFRVRLTVALFAFFVIPALAFAISSYRQLASDATQSRALVVSEALRALPTSPEVPLALAKESDRIDTPLLLYRGGELHEASDPLYEDLAPIGRFLPPPVEVTLAVRGEDGVTEGEQVDGTRSLFGYRMLTSAESPALVVAAPARAADVPLGRRRRDLGILVLLATAVGGLAALWLSGVAARQLAQPIGTLRQAALSLAAGTRTPPLEGEPTVEFTPVFTAFRRMAEDLNASRTALEEAQRRTAAVLRNVASGVVAVDLDRRVSLANPRAESLLGGKLAPGTPLDAVAPPAVVPLVDRFLASARDEEEFELSLDQQQLRGTLTRLARGGAVLTLDDVTEIARAQRVLAWGEMARQVAHEIKNPLTPIRLGVQHLRRARADSRVDFDRVLDQNVNQILTEIDRLDEIARAFSRYGAAPDERQRAAPIDVAAVVREVVSLEQMGQDTGVAWSEIGVDAPVLAMARTDELKEVLLNVLENARHAHATHVSIEVSPTGDGATPVNIAVRDDGHGIPANILPRIFEPHFSTRTSGSGLGLAISRQLVEGWGGTMDVESTAGQGTVVTLALRAPSSDA
ncbi:MAG TPA: ATP-binding protein [Gemmatimonadaceae bacterium]|nr:ATP-binding protein [Gemmatimonadaceae bacterium]